jgi:hypothetical protein
MNKYYLEVLKSEDWEQNNKIFGAFSTRKSDDNIEIMLSEESFFKINSQTDYFFDGKIKTLSYTSENVCDLQEKNFWVEKNYDFRKNGIFYKKYSAQDFDFLKEKSSKISEYLKKIIFNTSVEVLDTDTYVFEAQSGLNLLQGTLLQNENNDDFTLDFDASFYKEIDLASKKSLNSISFPNDDAEWRNMYAVLVAQSAINTEVQYQWLKAFKMASEDVKSDSDLLTAYSDSKPIAIFDRIVPITDPIFSGKLL